MWLWPSRKEWRRWSRPSKLTLIGTLVGVVSLALYFVDRLGKTAQGPAPALHAEGSQAFSVQRDNDYFEVSSRLGRSLWSARVKGTISQTKVCDLNGDGKNEVIVGVTHQGTRQADDTGKIISYDSSGRVVWTFDTNASFIYRGGLSNGLSVYDFITAPLLSRSSQYVVALSRDSDGWFPARVCAIDHRGRLLTSYWNPGVLAHVVAGSPSGSPPLYLVVGGVNNDLTHDPTRQKLAYCVFLLKPSSASGEAPPYRGSIGRGTHQWYGLIHPEGVRIDHLNVQDHDGDGKYEICVWTTLGHALYLDFTGHVVARALGDDATTSQIMVDFVLIEQRHREDFQ